MSRSTRLLQRKLALLMLVAATANAGAAAPSLPPTVTRDLPELTVQGGGELTFFRLSIYEDRELAQAFFAIRLDPRTSEPALRQLLGEP